MGKNGLGDTRHKSLQFNGEAKRSDRKINECLGSAQSICGYILLYTLYVGYISFIESI